MDKMDEEEICRAIKRNQLEDTLRGECLSNISDRVSRYLELNFIEVTPNEHFASISAECILLYRDGYFFACIALCQAVAEALVRFMCERSKFGASISQDFEENVGNHHLKPKVPTERTKLQAIAKSKIIALHNVESDVFAFELVGGVIKPKHHKYWPETHNGLLNAFLRFEP